MTARARTVGQAMAAARLASRTVAHAPVRSDILPDVLSGLRADPKALPPALFYDATGARLFEAICELPEYYVTRTEVAILAACAPEIAALAGEHCALVEYGSGAGVKVRYLLDQLRSPAAYVPVDISGEQLALVAAERAAQYPGLAVRPVCADYSKPLDLPQLAPRARRIAFFPGSTIGNFHPTEAAAFLRRVRNTIGPDGGLVLGVDRRKDPAVLHAAYNDAAGVTARFNLNILTRINRETGSAFCVESFRHRAFFNDEASRIEMHLESLCAQDVRVGGAVIHFESGETIHTECSYKYDRSRLDALVHGAGFRVQALWTDEREWFWEAFLVPDNGD